MKKQTEELLKTLNAENGPVYEMTEELETVEADGDDVIVNKSQFGAFLTVKLKDGSKRMVNLRGIPVADLTEAKVKELQEGKFKLQLWEAMRDFKNDRATIAKGAKRVFAVAA